MREMSGSYVLATTYEGVLMIGVDQGHYPGTDPCFKIRKVSPIRSIPDIRALPEIQEILSRRDTLTYGNGFDCGALIEIPQPQVAQVLEKLRLQ